MRISDWSSDVCSSDLHAPGNIAAQSVRPVGRGAIPQRILYDQQVGDEQQASTRRPYRQIAISLAGQFRFQQELGQIGFGGRSEEHTSELQSLMRISYAVFCLTKKNTCEF